MTYIPGRYEALCRAHMMRSMRDEGATTVTVGKIFGVSPDHIAMMIRWHEKLYPVMPAQHDILDQFRTDMPHNDISRRDPE